MKLSQVIKNYGKTETVNEPGYGTRVYQRERFTPESRKIMEDKVVAWFAKHGWKSKRQKPSKARFGDKNPTGWISRKPKYHAKIDWVLDDSYSLRGCAYLWVKTANGGWTNHEGAWNDADLDALVKAADNIPAPVLITKNTLPEPFKIGEGEAFTNHEWTDYRNFKHCIVTAGNKWRSVEIFGVVGLEQDGTISAQEVARPGETPWFHARIISWENGACEVITDGEILHPIKTRGKMRVTSNDPGSISDTAPLDKLILETAIGQWFEQQRQDNAAEEED